MKNLHITEDESGQRLDKYLARYMRLAPKSFLYKMLRKKNIKLNGAKAIGNEMLQAGDSVTLYLSEETIDRFCKKEQVDTIKSDCPFNILYENRDILFVSKPPGMLSQKAKKEDISLVEHIGSYLDKNRADGQVFSPGICNRLDRNTSGIVVAGKTLKGLRTISELIRERKMKKYYLCIVSGKIEKAEKLEGFLYKDRATNKVTVSPELVANHHVERILTAYEPLATNGVYTLLKVELITGKTHQIRSHLSSIGHPIIGDQKYGTPAINRLVKDEFGLEHQLLHSYEMVFEKTPSLLSDLENKTIQAPVPPIFKKIEDGLLQLPKQGRRKNLLEGICDEK